MTCPRPFRDPAFTRKGSPTPAPSNLNISYISSYKDSSGDFVEVDLFVLPSLSQRVVLGYGSSYELDFIVFHPTTPKPAPEDYIVLDDDGNDAVANIWRCVLDPVEGKYCSSIGQAKYGLTWTLNGDDADKGVVGTYGAGYGGAVTHFQFLCNWTVEHGNITFDDVGSFTPNWILVIHVHSRMFCPNYKASLRVLGGGSVFLIIVLSGTTLYLFVGVLVKILGKKDIEIPNQTFWEEVKESLLAAIKFIVSCGKETPKSQRERKDDLL
jgi:hypothetical protein